MELEKNAFIPAMSNREWDVFWLAAGARLTDQEIADTLQLGMPTIKTHKRRIRNALGVHGRASIAKWYEQNRALVADEWLKKTAAQGPHSMSEDNSGGQNHEKVYGFLATTADRDNGVLGGVGYLDSMSPVMSAFMKCHVALMRLTGVVVDQNDPPRPYLADGPYAKLSTAQQVALNHQDDARLAELADQALWARQAALGVLAATNALLDNVHRTMEARDTTAGIPMPIGNVVQPAA